MGLTPSQHALMQRWETFTSRLEQRSKDLRAEAEEGMQALVDEVLTSEPVETQTLFNALEGFKGRVDNLTKKLDKAWDEEAEPLFDAAEAHDDDDPATNLLNRACDHRDACRARLENAAERFQLRWGTNLFRQMWPRVEAALGEVAECSHCGQPMPGLDRRFPVHHTCASCGSENQVPPPALVGLYRAQAPHKFAQEASQRQREAIERFRAEVEQVSRDNDHAPESIESLDKWEAMEREYWTIFARVQTETAWDPPQKADELVASRMKMFRDQALMVDQRWRRAKGL